MFGICSAKHGGSLCDGTFCNDRTLFGVGIEVIGFERLASLLAIAIHLGHQGHDRACDVPVVLPFGLSHQHKLAKC